MRRLDDPMQFRQTEVCLFPNCSGVNAAEFLEFETHTNPLHHSVQHLVKGQLPINAWHIGRHKRSAPKSWPSRPMEGLRSSMGYNPGEVTMCPRLAPASVPRSMDCNNPFFTAGTYKLMKPRVKELWFTDALSSCTLIVSGMSP